MTAVENGSLNRNFQSNLKEIVYSQRVQIVTFVALANLVSTLSRAQHLRKCQSATYDWFR